MYLEIIQFWFEEASEALWFTKDEQFDALLRARFSDIHTRASHCELYSWRQSALGCLAEVIILDQFSRNMFRGRPESFAFDGLALALSQMAIHRGLDRQLTTQQRSFLYMPFMHSESAEIHKIAVELYGALGVTKNIQFEYKHKEIIDRFGRYPHRNEILGRVSTAEEKAFLASPGSGF